MNKVALLTIALLFSGSQFLQARQAEPWENPLVNGIDRLPARATSYSYATEAEALAPQSEVFSLDEQRMVEGVLTLAERSIRTVMTPRSEIGWLNLRKPIDEIISDARSLSHSIFPVCDGSLDHMVGLVKAKELINGPKDVESIRRLAAARQPLTVPETISVIRLVRDVKRTRASVVIVADEFGVVQGLATSHDILEAIAGDFPDEGDRDMVKKIVLPCTACHYCVSHCPQELDIPRILELYNEHCFTGGGFIAPMAVSTLPEDKRPSACIGCRSCEAVCPQQIKISEAMADFTERLKG